MADQTNTQVLIDGKVYNLSGNGDESEAYLVSVATYLNHKIEEVKALEFRKHMISSTKNLMIMINIADDYLKAKQAADESKELAALADATAAQLMSELEETKKQVVKLTKQLQNLKDKNQSLKIENAKMEAVTRKN